MKSIELDAEVIKKYKLDQFNENQKQVFLNHLYEMQQRILKKESCAFELTKQMQLDMQPKVIITSRKFIEEVFHFKNVDIKEVFLISFHLSLIK